MLATSSHARILYVFDSPPGFALSLHRAKAAHRVRSIQDTFSTLVVPNLWSTDPRPSYTA
jgi:hypothetical protein